MVDRGVAVDNTVDMTATSTAATPAKRGSLSRSLIINTLREAGGCVTNPDGRATISLQEALGDSVDPKSLVNRLAQMEKEGLIKREVRGKRTYAILLPDVTDDEVREVEAQTQRQGARAKVNGSVTEAGDTDVVMRVGVARSVDEPNYGLLAVELLSRVGEIIHDAGPDVLKQLAVQRAETEKWHKKFNELQAKHAELVDQYAAVKFERDGLRRQVQAVERNVQALLKGERAPDERGLRAIQKLMSETPKAKG